MVTLLRRCRFGFGRQKAKYTFGSLNKTDVACLTVVLVFNFPMTHNTPLVVEGYLDQVQTSPGPANFLSVLSQPRNPLPGTPLALAAQKGASITPLPLRRRSG